MLEWKRHLIKEKNKNIINIFDFLNEILLMRYFCGSLKFDCQEQIN